VRCALTSLDLRTAGSKPFSINLGEAARVDSGHLELAKTGDAFLLKDYNRYQAGMALGIPRQTTRGRKLA